MEIWQALVLGLVQGLGEFLPVSSSGHLVLAREIMGISGDYMLFDIMVHVGTLFAVLVAFYKDIIALFKPPFKTIGLLLLASVPAAVVGLLLNDTIADFFSDAKYIGFFFLFTAVLMLATEWLAVKRPYAERELPLRVAPSVGIKAALIMGGMQAVALFPGISRSGSTIFGRHAGPLAAGGRGQVLVLHERAGHTRFGASERHRRGADGHDRRLGRDSHRHGRGVRVGAGRH